MPSYKASRMSEDIRRIVSAKMRELKDPRLDGGDMLTVTRCEVSHDGSFCKVYVSSLDGEQKTNEAVKGLTSASGLLKREISNVLGLRRSPDLKFIADHSSESSVRIFEKLKSINSELEKKKTQQDLSDEENG